MRCSLCKSGEMQKSTDCYFAKVENGYIIIENVPCLKCSQCGEVIFSSSVMERLDEIIDATKNMISKVSIVEYSSAA